MKRRGLSLGVLMIVTIVVSAPWATSQNEAPVPAYNGAPPSKGSKLPPILMKDQLWGPNAQHTYQTHAYELAAKIPAIIHQQPCYCYCDRIGHNSLHSCFESTHGAQCATCLKEVYYSYLESKKGRTAAQIRQGIIRGDWKQIDLETAGSID